MATGQPRPKEGLPEETPEGVLIRVYVAAYLSTCHLKPRLRARAFMEMASQLLADEEAVTRLLPPRSVAGHGAQAKALAQAGAMFRAAAPALIAMLPAP